jgi:hypothetical protein
MSRASTRSSCLVSDSGTMEHTEDKDQISQRIVDALEASGPFSSNAWAAKHGLDHQSVVGALKSLAGKEIVNMGQFDVSDTTLSEEGQQYITLGSPEARLWNILTSTMSNTDAENAMNDKGAFKIGMMNAMKSGWIKSIKNADKTTSLERKADKIEDSVQAQLKLVASKQVDKVAKADLDNLKRRTLIQTSYAFSVFSLLVVRVDPFL